MKKLLLSVIRKIYLIRRLDSLLCAISYIISAIVTCSAFSKNPLSYNYWLLVFPSLYLITEIILLFIYKKIKLLKKTNRIDYFLINRKSPIVIKEPNHLGISIGNLAGFWSFSYIFIDVESLINSRITGIVIALLMAISILISGQDSLDLLLLLFIGFLLAIKMGSEGLIKES
jgi:hypothetical protein